VTPYTPPGPVAAKSPSLLLALLPEIQYTIVELLDPISSACLAMTSKRMHQFHRKIHGIVPLNHAEPREALRRPGQSPNPEGYVKLYFFLRDWAESHHPPLVWGGPYTPFFVTPARKQELEADVHQKKDLLKWLWEAAADVAEATDVTRSLVNQYGLGSATLRYRPYSVDLAIKVAKLEKKGRLAKKAREALGLVYAHINMDRVLLEADLLVVENKHFVVENKHYHDLNDEEMLSRLDQQLGVSRRRETEQNLDLVEF
jgi:hypothetical protein